MKGTSKVIMGATLVMIVSLAMVLGLILVLLAELYCSLLLRRRRRLRRRNSGDPSQPSSVSSTPTHQNHDQQIQTPQSHTTNLLSFYSQGVLQAPRSLLFPSEQSLSLTLTPKKQQIIEIPSPQQPQQQPPQISTDEEAVVEHFVYISNPVYENAETMTTPFETPDSSPSRLERGNSDSSGEENVTPPLTPMKKLPAEACSVSLRDARSLATSGSDSNSNNGGVGDDDDSSSSSASPCTSPSW